MTPNEIYNIALRDAIANIENFDFSAGLRSDGSEPTVQDQVYAKGIRDGQETAKSIIRWLIR